MRNASPVRAINAQVVSPTREPNCTNSAGTKPRAAPRRTVSAVTTPGGAQKAMARIKDEINKVMFLEYRPRDYLGLYGRAERPAGLRRNRFYDYTCGTLCELAIKVQSEFVRGRADADRVNFNLALVADVSLEQIGGEDIALK